MAIITGDFLMSAEQLVVGVDIMLKERLFPLSAAMTGIALLAAMLVMRIILEMTRYAGHIHLIFKRILGMTVSAGSL